MNSGIVADDLREHFQSQGLPADGGVDLRWVHLRVGPLPLAFPNIAARRVAVRYHDLHHVLTGYAMDWPGEAEIGAFEIASGCGRFWVGWLLDSASIGYGALLWPRRTLRAFVRGRHCRNLFGEPYEPLLRERTPELRRRLGLDRPVPAATLRDRAAFVLWAAIGLGWPLIVPLAAIVALLMWWS